MVLVFLKVQFCFQQFSLYFSILILLHLFLSFEIIVSVTQSKNTSGGSLGDACGEWSWL